MTTTSDGVAGVVLGRVDDIPLGEGRAYVVGDEQVAVFRLRSGGLRAVSAICPHAGGPLADGQIDERILVCPLHQHTFELATGCATSGQRDLRSYPVSVDSSGQVVLGRPG
jgi:nitrite reductase/ring-hydroxylating ferredoxin subunit